MSQVVPTQYQPGRVIRALESISSWLKRYCIRKYTAVVVAGLAVVHLITYFSLVADDIFNSLNHATCTRVLYAIHHGHWAKRLDYYGDPHRYWDTGGYSPTRARGCVRWASHGIAHNLWVMPWLSVTILSAFIGAPSRCAGTVFTARTDAIPSIHMYVKLKS